MSSVLIESAFSRSKYVGVEVHGGSAVAVKCVVEQRDL